MCLDQSFLNFLRELEDSAKEHERLQAETVAAEKRAVQTMQDYSLSVDDLAQDLAKFENEFNKYMQGFSAKKGTK